MIKFWSYKTEYEKFNKRFLNSIDKTLKRGQIFFGSEQALFEKNFLKYFYLEDKKIKLRNNSTIIDELIFKSNFVVCNFNVA